MGWVDTWYSLSPCTGVQPCERPSLQLPHDGLTPAGLLGGATQAVRKLVSDECGDMVGWRPLHVAAHHGQVEAVKVLVELGADKEAKGDDGVMPLHVAVAVGR